MSLCHIHCTFPLPTDQYTYRRPRKASSPIRRACRHTTSHCTSPCSGRSVDRPHFSCREQIILCRSSRLRATPHRGQGGSHSQSCRRSASHYGSPRGPRHAACSTSTRRCRRTHHVALACRSHLAFPSACRLHPRRCNRYGIVCSGGIHAIFFSHSCLSPVLCCRHSATTLTAAAGLPLCR